MGIVLRSDVLGLTWSRHDSLLTPALTGAGTTLSVCGHEDARLGAAGLPPDRADPRARIAPGCPQSTGVATTSR